MIKAIIVDDELSARNVLSKLLEKYCEEIQVVATAENVDEAEKKIIHANPDIVFLDIEMPGANGFDLLERFTNPTFEVIFTTAYEEYALKAFRYSAIDYIQKPIDFRLLIEAIGRYKQKVDNRFQKERYELLMRNMHFNSDQMVKIAIPTSNGFKFTQMSDIVYCKASRVYCDIHLLSGEIITASKSLKDFSELLPTNLFFRCHKSYLINLNHCVEYNRSEEQILLLNKDSVPLSQRSKSEYLALFH